MLNSSLSNVVELRLRSSEITTKHDGDTSSVDAPLVDALLDHVRTEGAAVRSIRSARRASLRPGQLAGQHFSQINAQIDALRKAA